jgi:ABC-type antimicrobial peptide transport system permease subunit
VVGALLVGLVAGLLPAASAARASVVQALRG